MIPKRQALTAAAPINGKKKKKKLAIWTEKFNIKTFCMCCQFAYLPIIDTSEVFISIFIIVFGFHTFVRQLFSLFSLFSLFLIRYHWIKHSDCSFEAAVSNTSDFLKNLFF